MRVLLVGCGAIGSTVARAAEGIPEIDLVLLLDARPGLAGDVAARFPKSRAVATLDEGVAAADLVVEAASQEAVATVIPRALAAGKDVVVVSSGALANDALREEIERAARSARRRVYVPSGALAGVDAVRAAREGGITRVTLTTAKPPAGYGKTAADVPGAITLFEGPARDAVKAFPKNVNVAAVLSMAGVGFDMTTVRVVADPALSKNTHTVEVEGAFGSMRIEVRNEPSPANAATSYLAALSVIALLRKLASPVHVGT